MPIIDAQVHCYERNHPGRPWTAVLAGPPEVTAEDMIKAMDEVGVDGAVQGRVTGEEMRVADVHERVPRSRIVTQLDESRRLGCHHVASHPRVHSGVL